MYIHNAAQWCQKMVVVCYMHVQCMHYLFIGRFSNCIVYYGLSLGASSLGGGRYLSLVLSGLVELPGLYVSYQLLNRYVQ